MMSASHASRRMVAGVRSRPSSVREAALPRVAQSIWPRRTSRLVVTVTRGRAPWESGTTSLSSACWAAGDQGVPEPCAVVAGVHRLLAGLRRVHGRGGGGEREQRGLEGGGVLEGAAALEPDPAGTVLGDREEPAQVRTAVLAVEVLLGVAFGPVRVDHAGQVAGGPGQLGRGEQPGLLEQEHLRPGPQGRLVGELVDRVHDHRDLFRGDRPLPQRGMRRGQVGDQGAGLADRAGSLGPLQPGQVGEPVRRGAPGEVGLGDLPGRDLGQHRCLEGGQVGAEGLELLDRADQLGRGPRRPEHLVQGPQLGARVGNHPGRGEGRERGVLHDPTQPEGTDSHGPLTCGHLTE